MPLKGNLRDFSIGQLLHLINLARKTGSLVIGPNGATGTTPPSGQVTFKEGKLIHAHLAEVDNTLPGILRKYGKLTDAQTELVRTRASHASDKELGLLLINAGYVNQADIVNCLRSHTLEIIYKLFAWTDGVFQFEPSLMPGPDKITVPMDLENVILEGARRMKEHERLVEEIPDLEMALKFTERPNTNIRQMHLSPEEWRVVSYISPKNPMRAIAKHNKLSDLELRRIVYGLIQAGLVEVVRPEGQAARPQATPTVRPTTSRPVFGATQTTTVPVVATAGARNGVANGSTGGVKAEAAKPNGVRPGMTPPVKAGATTSGPTTSPKLDDPKAKTGIIQRLISRIRSL